MSAKKEAPAALPPDQQRKWYIGKGSTWHGPYTLLDVLRRIHDGLATWVDFLWTPSDGMIWTRIANAEPFQQFLPKMPTENVLRDIMAAIASSKPMIRPTPSDMTGTTRRGLSAWFLQFEGSEFGPLTVAEVRVILKSGKLKGRLYGWCEGMSNWMPVDQIVELQEAASASQSSKSGDERRKSKRVPLVATVKFNIPGDTSAGASRYMGVCRDISREGLLVLSNRVPGEKIDVIRMEVSPLGTSGVEPFVTDVEVIRVLPDKKGFSVRFKKLSDSAKAAIDKYLSKN